MGNQPKLEWSQQREAKERAETLRPWQVKEIKVRTKFHTGRYSYSMRLLV